VFGHPIADVRLATVGVVVGAVGGGVLRLESSEGRVPETQDFVRRGHRVELALLRHLPLLAHDPVQVGQERRAGRRKQLGRWGRHSVHQLIVVIGQQFGWRRRQRFQTRRPAVLHHLHVVVLLLLQLLLLLLVVVLLLQLLLVMVVLELVLLLQVLLLLLVMLVRRRLLQVVIGKLDRLDGLLLVAGSRRGRGKRRGLRRGTGELTRGGRQRKFGRLPLDGAARRVVRLERHVATGRRTSRV